MTDEKTTETQGEQSLIDRANAAAERAEAAASRIEAANKRAEELLVRQTLGGTSEAGIAPVTQKVETPKEYKDRIMRGGV